MYPLFRVLLRPPGRKLHREGLIMEEGEAQGGELGLFPERECACLRDGGT